MNIYEIKKVGGSFDFESVPEISLENRYFQTPKDVKVFARIAYSDEGFYVFLRTQEPRHRAQEKGPLGYPYHDSCLEFFFAPDYEHPERYLNFEMNSNKCLYLGIRGSGESKARLVIDVDGILKPEVAFNPDGWQLRYFIPFDFIRIFVPDFSPKAGDKIRANCFKCGDMMSPEEYLSWSPVPTEGFTFHRPDCFGTMIFGE